VTETPESLDVAAFKHVVVPIGVVVGLGVARLMTALSHYLQQRQRVRFSTGHGLWCALLFLWLVGLWWIAWGLRRVDTELWSFFTLIFLLSGPCLVYLAVTLLLPDLPEQGELDLGERFESLGRAFFLSMAGFVLWLALSEVWLLREAWIVLPKRLFQGTALSVFLIGAAFPSRRVATVLGAILLPVAVVALATVRARLG
jgi:hypothetical protein